MKIAISAEKLNTIRTILIEKDVDALVRETPNLIAIVDSLLNLFEGLAVGLRIIDIRRMFGVVVDNMSKGATEESPESDSQPTRTINTTDGSDKKPTPEAQNESDSASKTSPPATDTDQPETDKKTDPDKNKNHPGKCGVDSFPLAKKCHHHHTELKPGDECPECRKGKLKLARPRQQILFEGAPPIQPVAHFLYDLKCKLCDKIFRVKPPSWAQEEGLGICDRYGYSAIAMIVIIKYFADLPWYRNARLHGMFDINLSPSSQFDQTEKLANVMKPVADLERLIAAQSGLFMIDDTNHNILDQSSEVKIRRTTGEAVLREGCHSSVVIAFNKSGHPIVQVKTGIIHAGEWLDQILLSRKPNLPKPLVASDRLSANKVTVTPVVEVACNQHARQNFYNDRANGPKLVQTFLDWYRKIFKNDAATREMTSFERLVYHRKNSAPIMDNIVTEASRLLEEKVVTPNSSIGGDCQYILNHEPELRGFHTHEGAPLSNNLTERVILYLVLLRKNIHFFKTTTGAAIADTIFSIGLSAFLSGTNLFQYFRLATLNAEDVRKNPENWLPWKFNERYPEYIIEYPDRKRQWPPNRGSPIVSPWLENINTGDFEQTDKLFSSSNCR